MGPKKDEKNVEKLVTQIEDMRADLSVLFDRLAAIEEAVGIPNKPVKNATKERKTTKKKGTPPKVVKKSKPASVKEDGDEDDDEFSLSPLQKRESRRTGPGLGSRRRRRNIILEPDTSEEDLPLSTRSKDGSKARKTPKVGEDDDGAQIEDFAKNAGAPNKEEPPRGMFEL